MTLSTKIKSILKTARPEQVNDGMFWYAQAHSEAQNLAITHALTLEQAAGIIAVLSPGTRWEQNIKDARSLCTLKDNTTVTTYSANKKKALRILQGEDVKSNIGGYKVTSFYDNILRPELSNEVTLDRHMLRGLIGGSDKELIKIFDSRPRYHAIADCIRKSARARGIRPHQLQAILWNVVRERGEL